MKHTAAMILAMLFGWLTADAGAYWVPDTAGLAGYEMHRFDQGRDYSGPVRSTVVRRLSDCRSGRGVLYIHGFNDYFFQQALGDSCAARCYDFYAVDLRKYGRSILPGQKPFMTRSMNEYFADIDSALSVMRRSGVSEIVLMGHSTGGLLAAYYMAMMTRDDSAAVADIRCLVLNSPFLDWNLGKMECFVPAVSFIGLIAPNVKVKNGGGAYSESLLKSRHGEWTYNTDWKREGSSDVNLGWVRAIDRAQRKLRSMRDPIHVPVLLMYSARSVHAGEWTEACDSADTVLDVADISNYGRRLSKDVTAVLVNGGLHDLVLSRKDVRDAVYSYMFRWLAGELGRDVR